MLTNDIISENVCIFENKLIKDDQEALEDLERPGPPILSSLNMVREESSSSSEDSQEAADVVESLSGDSDDET